MVTWPDRFDAMKTRGRLPRYQGLLRERSQAPPEKEDR
jgi:hypothetical protein